MSKKNTPSTHHSEYPAPKGKLLAVGEKGNKYHHPEENSNQEGSNIEVPGSMISVLIDGKIIKAAKIYEVESETPVSVREINIHFSGKREEFFP